MKEGEKKRRVTAPADLFNLEAPDLLSYDREGERDTSLWIDKYVPTQSAELAVHKRKVDDVRNWLIRFIHGGAIHQKVLILTGPCGSGKSATVHMLAEELSMEVAQWQTPIQFHRTQSYHDRAFSNHKSRDALGIHNEEDEQKHVLDAFADFMKSLDKFASLDFASLGDSRSENKLSRLLLLDDVPPLLSNAAKLQFQSILRKFATSPTKRGPALVFVISDVHVYPGEEEDASIALQQEWMYDVRHLVPPDILNSSLVHRISFNPVAKTVMKPLMQKIIEKEKIRNLTEPVKEAVWLAGNGDIRSTIQHLQFVHFIQHAKHLLQHGSSTVMQKGNKDMSVELYHLFGKILFAKRTSIPLFLLMNNNN